MKYAGEAEHFRISTEIWSSRLNPEARDRFEIDDSVCAITIHFFIRYERPVGFLRDVGRGHVQELLKSVLLMGVPLEQFCRSDILDIQRCLDRIFAGDAQR